MNLKCVYCGKEARYLYKGTSLCKDHLYKELNPEVEKQEQEIVVINAPEVPE